MTEIEDRLKANTTLLKEDVSIADFFQYAPIRDRISVEKRNRVLAKLNGEDVPLETEGAAPKQIGMESPNATSPYAIDEPLISEVRSSNMQL